MEYSEFTERNRRNIFSKIAFGPIDQCWEWQSPSVGWGGYGSFAVSKDGKNTAIGAHRAIYQIMIGPIPDGILACHTCDNRICCNPFHIFLGTTKENAADMAKKGRAPRNGLFGKTHGRTHLDDEDIFAIRNLRRHGSKIAEIAIKFGIADSTVSAICTRRIWKHLP